MLKKNQTVELFIDSLSNDGNGIGRYDGMAVFVPFSAPGDHLRIKIVKVHSSHAFGIVEEILQPSASRIPADCGYYRKCGGCQLRHLQYSEELAAKERFVADAMRRLGGIAFPVSPILPSPEKNRYRNKVQYPLTNENGYIQAGFFAGRSHRVIPCGDCLLQPELLNQIVAKICKLLEEYHISIYYEAAHTGLVRHIYLRHGVHSGEVLVCLVVNGASLPSETAFCQRLTEAFPCVKTIVLNINQKRTNVILGTQCRILTGDGYIHDTLCGVPVRLDPLSFYQVNTLGAEQLYSTAAKLVNLQSGELLLDLYCGMGTIGLSLAKKAKLLIGVEIVPQAIENAKRAAQEMGISKKCRFLAADAAQAAAQLSSEKLRPDVVILDPPRKGCEQAALDAVVSMRPSRICMVSCNPATAARDVQYLTAHDYTVNAIQPVDMFPGTKHVECVCLMTRKEK